VPLRSDTIGPHVYIENATIPHGNQALHASPTNPPFVGRVRSRPSARHARTLPTPELLSKNAGPESGTHTRHAQAGGAIPPSLFLPGLGCASVIPVMSGVSSLRATFSVQEFFWVVSVLCASLTQSCHDVFENPAPVCARGKPWP
jgi:hypothetical protein